MNWRASSLSSIQTSRGQMANLTVLVPLDGSKLSEAALELLPFVRSLGFSEVRLVSVWEGVWEDLSNEEESFGGRDDSLWLCQNSGSASSRGHAEPAFAAWVRRPAPTGATATSR